MYAAETDLKCSTLSPLSSASFFVVGGSRFRFDFLSSQC